MKGIPHVVVFWWGCWPSPSRPPFERWFPIRLTTAFAGFSRRTTRSPSIARSAGSRLRTAAGAAGSRPPRDNAGHRFSISRNRRRRIRCHPRQDSAVSLEQKAIAQGDTGRSSIAPENYLFEPSGVDPDGLARVLLSPRRKDRVLVAGAMFLQPGDGALVRLQGRLAKSPSFWVKNVDIVRSSPADRGLDLPVALESKADIRLFGPATLRMTYVYTEVTAIPCAHNGSSYSAPRDGGFHCREGPIAMQYVVSDPEALEGLDSPTVRLRRTLHGCDGSRR